MSSSLNKVMLIGHLGADPEIRTFQSGDKVATFSLATSENWKDKATGERKSKTQWHKIAVFNQNLVNLCEKYIHKGSKIYIEGRLETRSYEKEGETRYITEVTLKPYNGELKFLDKVEGSPHQEQPAPEDPSKEDSPKEETDDEDDFDDEIPF